MQCKLQHCLTPAISIVRILHKYQPCFGMRESYQTWNYIGSMAVCVRVANFHPIANSFEVPFSRLLLRLESILFTFNEIRPTFVIGLSVFCCVVVVDKRIEMLSIFKAMSLFTFVSHLRTRRRGKKSHRISHVKVSFMFVRGTFTCSGKCIVK